MSFDDLSKGFEGILDSLIEWVDACRHPIRHCDEVLLLKDDKAKIRKSMHLWLIIFLLNLILQLPLMKLAGIEWDDVAFQLPNFVALTTLFFLAVVLLHFGMRIYGIQSKLHDTLAAYTTLVGVYGPLLGLFSYPYLLQFFSALKNAKSQRLSFSSAMQLVFLPQMTAPQHASPVPALVMLPGLLSAVAGMAAFTMLGRKLSQIYCAPKSRTLASLGFGLFMGFPITLALMSFVYLITYISTKG